MIRVVIADDQGMFRAGLRSLLQTEPDLEVVAEASDGVQAVAAASRFAPDVVLMDIRMPELDGIAATREIVRAQPHIRVLMLTTFDLDEYVFRALRAGASGFLVKDASAEDLVDGIRVVAQGEGLLAPSAARRVIEAFACTAEPPAHLLGRLEELSAREREVLALLARGWSNLEIAGHLVVSPATVKSHVHSLLGKIGARDRVQAVVFAYESGVVSPGG